MYYSCMGHGGQQSSLYITTRTTIYIPFPEVIQDVASINGFLFLYTYHGPTERDARVGIKGSKLLTVSSTRAFILPINEELASSRRRSRTNACKSVTHSPTHHTITPEY
jgi:hypothetical protein